MKDIKEILAKITELESELELFRNNVKQGKGFNKDLVNEPLFNQIQALRWALNLEMDEEILKDNYSFRKLNNIKGSE